MRKSLSFCYLISIFFCNLLCLSLAYVVFDEFPYRLLCSSEWGEIAFSLSGEVKLMLSLEISTLVQV